jgi:hypothetical protein
MTKLEQAINTLGQKSWHGINVVTGNTDFWPIGEAGYEEHKENCPIWNLYKELVHAAIDVKREWLKTSKQAKDMLFKAAMEEKENPAP